MKKNAFTLVELLTVIGIILILAGILLPALSKARATAMQTSCLNNMSQLGKAEAAFMADNQQRMAPDCKDDDYKGMYSYCGSLYEYLGKDERVFTCTEEEEESDKVTITYSVGNTFKLSRFSYFVNLNFHANDEVGSATKWTEISKKWLKFSTVESPSRKLSLAEKKESVEYATNGSTTTPTSNIEMEAHKKISNYLYLDGHAEGLLKNAAEDKLSSAWAK